MTFSFTTRYLAGFDRPTGEHMPSAAAAYANTAVSGYGDRSATGNAAIATSGDRNSATRRTWARRRSFLATGGSAQDLDANSKWNIAIDGGSTFGPLSAATAPAWAFEQAAPVAREAGGGAASGSGSNIRGVDGVVPGTGARAVATSVRIELDGGTCRQAELRNSDARHSDCR
ncbi:hypothetical protein [Burkholderia mayonis]|uniref:hypothetical protein n=1 Tax=Burkholderia mayonis TaxID=1385591 RepID=UPI00131F273E|nr:hypothetical protein [Burkholderia mayonis]